MNKDEIIKSLRRSVFPGWWGLLDKYVPQILDLDPDCEILVKQKFGRLRIGVFTNSDKAKEIRALREAAERESANVCEICGKPGKLRTNRDWIETLCWRCVWKSTKKKQAAHRKAMNTL